MKLINNSERAIRIGNTLLVPTVEVEVEEKLLENARLQELLRLKDISKVLEASE